MAKTALVAEDRTKERKPENKPNSLVERTTTGIQSGRDFLTDVRAEMRKVVTPSRKEVQATTTVVLVTVFIFAFYFWVVDGVFTFGLNKLLSQLVGPQ
jgi:preprotein translocase subunit SecE